MQALCRSMGAGIFTLSAAVLALALAACGDDDAPADGAPPGGDGGAGDASSTPDAWAPLEPAPPALPMPPALPAMTPCPAGWIEASEGGLTWCEPWAEDVSASCAIGEAQRPGEAGCVRIGSACPPGDWPADLPAGATVVYVRAGATGGDGSIDRPFGRVGEATASAPAGAIIALAAGTYDEYVQFAQNDLEVRGACAARTRVTLTGTITSTFTVRRTGIVLRDLTIGPTTHMGVAVLEGASVRLEGVVIDRAVSGAVAVIGGTATLLDVAIEDPRPEPPAGDFGRALQIQSGAQVALERCSIRGADDVAFIAEGAGTMLRIVGSAVRDSTGHAADGSYGRGLNASMGATVEILRSAFHRHRDQAVFATHAGTTVRIDQSSFADTRTDAVTGAGGIATGAHRGASIEVQRTTIDRSDGAGMVADEAGTSVLAEDVIVRDTGGDQPPGPAIAAFASGTVEARRIAIVRAYAGAAAQHGGSAIRIEDATVVDSGYELGAGIIVEDSGAITATRVSLTRSRGTGVLVGAGSQAILRDLSVARTDPAGPSPGRAAEVWGGRLEIRGASIDDAVEAAVLASDGATLVVEDATIRGTRATSYGFGRGISVQLGATAEIDRVALSDNYDTGIFAGAAGTVAHARDVVIERTRPLSNGEYGRGISVQYGATLTLERGTLRDNHELGVCAIGEGTAVTLGDVRVVETLARPCAADGCDPGGHGIGVYDGTLVAERIEIADSALCGVHVARDGQLDLAHGVIRGNAIGACVQVPGYDVARLMNDVQYLDNGLTLDTQELPIPEPAL